MENTPSVLSFGSVGSKKESEGPLGQYFDVINPDSTFGESSWERAESKMVQISVGVGKAGDGDQGAGAGVFCNVVVAVESREKSA